MAGGSFVNRADGGVPSFPECVGVGQDGQEAMLQFKVRVAQDGRVGIAGHGIETEIRRSLARGGAVHIIGLSIGVSELAVPTITRVRPLELRRQVIGITTVRVGEQDNATEVFVSVKSTEDRAAIFGPDPNRRRQIEILLGHGFEALRIEAFDRRDQVKRQLLIDRQTASPT